MKKCLLIAFISCMLTSNSFYSTAQVVEGENICPIEIKLSEENLKNTFRYGVYRKNEAEYDYIKDENREYTDVPFVKLNLAFDKSNGDLSRGLEYTSAKNNSIIAPTRKGNRGGKYQVRIKFGTYGLPHKGEITRGVPFLAKPYGLDSIKNKTKTIEDLFKDLLTYNRFFIYKLNFKDPYLLIVKEKKDKRSKWEGSTSGEAYGYYFILWDKSKVTKLPDIVESPMIENYELIKIKIPEITDATHRLIYVDMSQIKNRKGLYKELKQNFKAWKKIDKDIKFDLFISNGNEPYIENDKNYKKALKYIRLTETELPIANQDIEYIEELTKKKKIFGTHGVLKIHYYLSDLFYQTNAEKTGKRGEVPLYFINELIRNKDCGKLKNYIHIESENNEFEKFEYDCNALVE